MRYPCSRQGNAMVAALLGLLVAAGTSCSVEPLPEGGNDRVVADVQREIERFRTKTNRNAACKALMQVKARAGSLRERKQVLASIYRTLSRAVPNGLPPDCVDLLAQLPQAPPDLFASLLRTARSRKEPRVFAAAARALGQRQGRQDLLAAAALLTQMTGDGSASLAGLDCAGLAKFFDDLVQNRPTTVKRLLADMGWQTAAPLRQAAWWLMVRRGCARQAWARTNGVAPMLQARATSLIHPTATSSITAMTGSTPAIQAMVVEHISQKDPRRWRALLESVKENPCPRDPGRRLLVVALLETLLQRPDPASKKMGDAILERMARCGPAWKTASGQWYDKAQSAVRDRP